MGELSTRRGCCCRLRRRHLEFPPDVLARELYLEFPNWNLTHMRDIWTLRPGFYTEFRAGSIQQSDLAWGAILEKMLIQSLLPTYKISKSSKFRNSDNHSEMFKCPYLQFPHIKISKSQKVKTQINSLTSFPFRGSIGRCGLESLSIAPCTNDVNFWLQQGCAQVFTCLAQ